MEKVQKIFLKILKKEAETLLKEQKEVLTESLIHLALVYGAAYPPYKPSIFQMKN